MIEVDKEEQLARESIIRKIDRLIEDLVLFKEKIEKLDSLYEVYCPCGMRDIMIEYGKLILLSIGYRCIKK
jgi:hypothetical protein